MATQQTKTTSCEKAATKTTPTLPMVTVTITTLHEDKPLVVQVPQGSTVRAALTQAGIEIQQGWEAYVDGKLASLDTTLAANAELFYVVRVAGGK